MKRNLPPLTIGIPFFNAEKTLLDAVKSVFSQTHTNWELILIDDGSTDRSLEIARSINDQRVRVYSDGRNKRLGSRLNEIARLARFNYIMRMDADDMMCRERAEQQLNLLVENKNFDLVSTGVISVSDDFIPLGMRCVSKEHVLTPRKVMAGQSGIVHASILGRRDWFLRNPYDESFKLAEDTNLWIRAYGKDDLKIKILRDTMYFYREDGSVKYSKLKDAYSAQRRTIASQSLGYRFIDRVTAYTAAQTKSSIAFVLNSTGRMDVLRKRRIAASLTQEHYFSVCKEINEIRAINLPLTSQI